MRTQSGPKTNDVTICEVMSIQREEWILQNILYCLIKIKVNCGYRQVIILSAP